MASSVTDIKEATLTVLGSGGSTPPGRRRMAARGGGLVLSGLDFRLTPASDKNQGNNEGNGKETANEHALTLATASRLHDVLRSK